MKGFIAYSSKTGNTKRMAEFLFEELKETFDLALLDLKNKPDLLAYDFGLIGGWCDRALPDKAAMKAIGKSPKKLGLFLTMGAMPTSKHGERTMAGLVRCLKEKGKESLGTYLCPGKVEERFAVRIDLIPPLVVSRQAKEQMKEAARHSRLATEEELLAASDYFKTVLSKYLKGGNHEN